MVDSSVYGEPLVFTIGQNGVMPGIEDMAVGMTVGESKTEKIPPQLAFGPYHEDLCCQVSSDWLEAQHVSPKVGLELEVRKTDGALVRLVVTEMDGDRITLDANHRLAGKNVILQLEILKILGSSALDS